MKGQAGSMGSGVCWCPGRFGWIEGEGHVVYRRTDRTGENSRVPKGESGVQDGFVGSEELAGSVGGGCGGGLSLPPGQEGILSLTSPPTPQQTGPAVNLLPDPAHPSPPQPPWLPAPVITCKTSTGSGLWDGGLGRGGEGKGEEDVWSMGDCPSEGEVRG